MRPAGFEPPSLQQAPTGHDAYMFRASFSASRCSPGGSIMVLQPSPCPCGCRSQPSQLCTSPFAHHSAVDWPRRRCDYRMPPHVPAYQDCIKRKVLTSDSLQCLQYSSAFTLCIYLRRKRVTDSETHSWPNYFYQISIY